MSDLVAELTLVFRSEINAGIDEVRGELDSVAETVAELNENFGGLDKELSALGMPTGLLEGMTSLNADADELLSMWQQIGVQIDTDTSSIRNMNTELQAVLGEMADAQAAAGHIMPGGSGDGGGGVPPIIPPDPNEPDPDEPTRPGAGHAGNAMTHVFMAGVGAAVAKEAAEKYAAFDQILYQTAIKEGFGPDDAGPRVQQLTTMLDSMALKTGNSSTDLAEAYYWLTTTGMKPQLIDQLMPSIAKDATAYGNSPIEDAQSVFTLHDVLGVPADQMQQGLSVISKAAQLGHFGVGDYGTYLPGIGAQLSLLKDTGIGGLVQASAAIEASRKVFSSSEEDAADISDLVSYLASPIAGRFFDRTKRSEDLLPADTRALFKKYHLDGIDISKYLDDREATGEGSFDSMMDLARLIETKLPANISGTDEEIIFKSLFHNQQAAKAAMGIAQNFDTFKQDEATLYGVNDSQVQTAFNTSINSPQTQVNVVDEQFEEMTRILGANLIPSLTLLGNAANLALTGLNGIGSFYDKDVATPVGGVIGSFAAHAKHWWDTGTWDVPNWGAGSNPPAASPDRLVAPAPIHLTVYVDKSGNVIASTAPGTNVQVNQGNMLGTH